MERSDGLALRHNVEIVLRGPDGQVKQREAVHNLVVTLGKEAAMDNLLAAPSLGKPTHMAIGKSSEEAKAADTKLKEELGRVALGEKTRSAKVLTMKAEFPAGTGTGEVKEAGVFSASSEGTLFLRSVFSVVNKAAEDTLTVIWKWTGE